MKQGDRFLGDTTEWTRIEPTLRRQAEAVINNDPSVLLERDGGPVGMTADVVLARLYGFDDQVDHDWRIRRVEPVLLTPIVEPLTAIESEPSVYAPMRTASYRLQSNFAQMRLDFRFAPEDVKPGPDFMFDVLFVRYRREVTP